MSFVIGILFIKSLQFHWLENNMSSFLVSYWHKRVWNSVRDYYLTLPNASFEGWEKISENPLSFNLIWRSALNQVVIPKLDLNSDIPPSCYRNITEFSFKTSGRDEYRNHDKSVSER